MSIYSILFVFLQICWTMTSNMFEIDVLSMKDENPTHLYNITIGQSWYYCKPKTPPLSHGWSYECEENRRH